mmetsp:Transcript_32523/g.97825  ORF Transcript_32523/g.97825 Transcript_32523/m.97825 type:complete len:106 (-) Transcript_32523:4168-4485(-)
MQSRLLERGEGAIAEFSSSECEERCYQLRRMLSTRAPMEPQSSPSMLETHRNSLLKEMAWMAADFKVESQLQRSYTTQLCAYTGKRHSALRKKRAKVCLWSRASN